MSIFPIIQNAINSIEIDLENLNKSLLSIKENKNGYYICLESKMNSFNELKTQELKLNWLIKNLHLEENSSLNQIIKVLEKSSYTYKSEEEYNYLEIKGVNNNKEYEISIIFPEYTKIKLRIPI